MVERKSTTWKGELVMALTLPKAIARITHSPTYTTAKTNWRRRRRSSST